MKKIDNKNIDLYDHPEIYYKDNYSDLLKLTNKKIIIRILVHQLSDQGNLN